MELSFLKAAGALAGSGPVASGSARNTPLRQRLVVVTEAREVDKGVGAVALHGHERNVAAEVARVGARDWEAVAQACERRAAKVRREVVCVVEAALLDLVRSCREQVRPDAWHVRPRDTAALVRDLQSHVLVVLAVGDDDFDRRHLEVADVGAGPGGPQGVLDGGAHRVFKELEHDVVQVIRHVAKGQIEAAVDLDFWRVSELTLAERSRLLDGISGHVGGLDVCVEESDTAVAAAALPEGEVLPDEHSDADATRIKRVEKPMDSRVIHKALVVAHRQAELVRAARHGEEHRAVPLVDGR
mmetsp:Transcript_23182/g.82807  ORF Transcript_23182/g.82807 Transcript_23182/m.82807 type:complete len:300 (-) Transcript_23182:440-1339(-)